MITPLRPIHQNGANAMTIHKMLLGGSLATLLGAAMAIPSPLLAANRHHVPQQASIGMAEARAVALKAFPGTIVKQELEREGGGSGLRYSFDMREGRHWREVGVDAMTGRVLEDAREGANPGD
jgi:uncharacterized membrane protein YkoI